MFFWFLDGDEHNPIVISDDEDDEPDSTTEDVQVLRTLEYIVTLLLQIVQYLNERRS